MFKFITHRPLWVNILAGIVLAILILFLLIFSLQWCTNHNQSKTIPSVLGKTLDEAEDILDNAGFKVEILDSIYADTAKPLTVLKQVPEAEDVVKINRTVYLTINRAVPPIVEMPNIVGYSYRSAEMAIRNANLRIEDTTYENDFAMNTVRRVLYEKKPITPGTKLRMGSQLVLILSNGIGQQRFPVPGIIGMTFCDAKSRLQAMGLDIGSIVSGPGESITDTCSAYIYKQSPERFDEDRKFRYIHSGQLMDVWLQAEQPDVDTLQKPPEPGEPQ